MCDTWGADNKKKKQSSTGLLHCHLHITIQFICDFLHLFKLLLFFLLKVRGHQLYFCFKENEIKITFLCQTLLLDVYFDIQSRAQIRLFGGPDLVREPPVDYLCTNPAVKFIPISFILIIWTQ